MSGCDPFGAICAGDERRQLVRASGTLCGIDDIEVYDDGVTLCVQLFGTVPRTLVSANVVITGGTRITSIQVLEVEIDQHEDQGTCLRVTLDRTGDLSSYCLCLVAAPAIDQTACSFVPLPVAGPIGEAPEGVDPRYACAPFSFHVDCPREGDCAPAPCPASPAPADIAIDYLARDFTGFRQLLLDRLALTMPDWQESHLPDVQLTLVELLAYLGDRLSYQLDGVATEAYLATARRRMSIRRHARLLDYRMHDGCNARAFVCVEITGGDLIDHPVGDFIFAAPDPAAHYAPAGLVTPQQIGTSPLIFEPLCCAADSVISLREAHGSISFYTWRQSQCCLPKGATRATLRDGAAPIESAAGALADGGRLLALQAGDLLVLEEIRGSVTGSGADVDPAKRWPVRLTAVEKLVDPLDGTPLLEIAWALEDALPFALTLCAWTAPDGATALRVAAGGSITVSARDAAGEALPEGGIALDTPPTQGSATVDPAGMLTYTAAAGFTGSDTIGLTLTTPGGTIVAFTITVVVGGALYCQWVETAVARGNVVLVDQGGSVIEDNDGWLVTFSENASCCACEGTAADVQRVGSEFSMTLAQQPVTQAAAAPCDPSWPAAAMLTQDLRATSPAAALDMAPAGGDFPGSFDWSARFDLLDSGGQDRAFVVEIDETGQGRLRFGDGDCGMVPPGGARFRARYRVGNGALGNVPAEAISLMALRRTTLDGVALIIRNPLPAAGGCDPEPIEQVRRLAPHAYGQVLERAVTALDYATIAERDPRLQGASARLAWMGIGDEADVALDVLAAAAGERDLARSVLTRLEAVRRIGHDVAVTRVDRVPLRIAAHVCVDPAYRRDDIAGVVRVLLSAGALADGSPALFHPDRLTFGQDIFASAIIAAIQSVEGVVHVELTHFARLDDDKPEAEMRLIAGTIAIAADEIAQCDSDPDFPEHGSVALRVIGGR